METTKHHASNIRGREKPTLLRKREEDGTNEESEKKKKKKNTKFKIEDHLQDQECCGKMPSKLLQAEKDLIWDRRIS